MSAPLTLSLDAMGGDFGPDIVVPGAALALDRHPGIRFLLFGDQAKVGPVLAQHPKLQSVSTLRHTDVAVRMDDKPSQALRQGRRVSSMWKAIEAVKSGEAQAAISAGNTGALMAMAMFCLKCMNGIDRPALAALWPTLNGESVVLDVGASIGADAPQLVKLAVMGAAMAQIVFDRRQPSVGLLNVGVEEMKGIEEVKEAGRFLRENPLQDLSYRGFIEGDDIGKGVVDVVVTEGFAGNIALKTAEGTAKQIAEYLRSAMKSSLMTKIGYLFARGGFASLKEKLDPRRANGGVFLGLNGVVIKSHGGTDSLGFAAAIDLGYDMAHFDLRTRISAILSNLGDIDEKFSQSHANSVKSKLATATDGENR